MLYRCDGLYLRKDTTDRDLLRECEFYIKYIGRDLKNEVVLDIGGCFGGFTYLVLKYGCEMAIVVEPLQSNIKLLKKNIMKFKERVKIYEAACIIGKRKKTSLYTNIHINPFNFGSGSTIKRRGRIREEIVKTVNYNYLLKKYKPTIIKMDCEGQEYSLLLNSQIPSTVTKFIVEMHLGRKIFKKKSRDVVNLFKDWKCILEPVGAGEGSTKKWHAIGIWER